MRTLSPKLIIEACHLAFNGNTNKQIADTLEVTPATISNWKKTQIWQQTQTLLVENYVKKTIKKKM